MIDKNTQEKIEFRGTIRSVQPRSNVWRYRLNNRTHRMTGYNLFLYGIAEGEEREISDIETSVGRRNSLPAGVF